MIGNRWRKVENEGGEGERRDEDFDSRQGDMEDGDSQSLIQEQPIKKVLITRASLTSVTSRSTVSSVSSVRPKSSASSVRSQSTVRKSVASVQSPRRLNVTTSTKLTTPLTRPTCTSTITMRPTSSLSNITDSTAIFRTTSTVFVHLPRDLVEHLVLPLSVYVIKRRRILLLMNERGGYLVLFTLLYRADRRARLPTRVLGR